MMYKFGDKEVNTEHLYAISEPKYDDYHFYVNVYFIGDSVQCNFKLIEGERPKEKNTEPDKTLTYRWGLKLKNGEINWNEGGQSEYYTKFSESLIYERMMKEIDKLKSVINAHKR